MNAPPAQTRTAPSISPRAALCDAIQQNADILVAYLPATVSKERFLALAQRAVLDNRDLWDCDSQSVLKALSAAAASGLKIDGKMSSLIVRKSKDGKPTATWDPSFRGMCYLALESGHVASVEAHCVFAKDEFSVELGTSAAIVHRPCLTGERGRVTASYAIATLRDGGVMREVLGIADLEKIRAMSPAAEKGPWVSWPERMAVKSAMRRLLKKLPAADIGSRVAHAHRYVAEAGLDPDAGESYQARLALPGKGLAEPQDTAAIEERALLAISEAASAGTLLDVWNGIKREFRQMGVEVPLLVESKHNDRAEALKQLV